VKDYYDTSRSIAADPMCGAYSGGTSERASRIIYKVAQACGINPQVLIVMLQKEQGLVLSSAPSAYNYRAAMGQGCPDTAACDTRYYGFFNQVYGAAWQLKRYANPPGTTRVFTWYEPGKTWNIRFHPDATCGSSPVYIQNQATANLYYYTPYQPNKAALAAGYGASTDKCSAYGNRNFYQFFTDWFGSTQYVVSGAIATEWIRRGGAEGQLGQPTGSAVWTSANGGGWTQSFTRGMIWNSAVKPAVAYSIGAGPFLTGYLSARAHLGGWGWPTENPRCGLAAAGCAMYTTKGTVYYSSPSGTHMVLPAMNAHYLNQGGPGGRMGYPAEGLRRGADGSYEQRFQTAFLVHQQSVGTVELSNRVVTAWKAKGGLTGPFGYPQQGGTVRGSGAVYPFKGGSFFESAAAVVGIPQSSFLTAYMAAGGPSSPSGWPTADPQCGFVDGGCVVRAESGYLTYSLSTGLVLTTSAVATAWLGNRGPNWIGYPTGAPKPLPGGTVQAFQRGEFFESASAAVGMTYGGLGAAYRAMGGPTGPAGWPTGKAVCGQVDGGCLMPMERGTIAYSASTKAQLVPTAASQAWLSNRGPLWLGYPVAPSKEVQGGLTQLMQRGVLYTYAGLSVGLANGPLGLGYIALGAQGGAAGWPTAAARCGLIAGGCLMQTVNGAIAYSPSGGTRFVPLVILKAWQDRQAMNGPLGYPVAAPSVSGTVTTQRFERGTLVYDSATGVVSVR
jgi:uncharacterized protein with LGFP repeats